MMRWTSMTAILCGAAWASEGGPAWDKFPKERSTDIAALQNGAKLFVNYCLNCHSAGYMRYNRLEDLGLTEQQIRDNLIFTGVKVGADDHMVMTTASVGRGRNASGGSVNGIDPLSGKVLWTYGTFGQADTLAPLRSFLRGAAADAPSKRAMRSANRLNPPPRSGVTLTSMTAVTFSKSSWSSFRMAW